MVYILSKVNVCFKLNGRPRELTFQNIESTRSNSDGKKLKAPLEVKTSYHTEHRYIEKTIRKDQFEMEDWMEHFQTILNFRSIDSIIFDLFPTEYDSEDIKKYFGMPSSLDIEHTGNYAYNQAILQTFLPVESLIIAPDVFENSKVPPEILIQQFTSLTIVEFMQDDSYPRVVTLDDLLLINSKSIDVKNARMGPKDINRFIKLWQHGANPRMEYIFITYEKEKEDDEETILKGINYLKISNEWRSFRFPDCKKPVEDVFGGIDILRNDGVNATIRFDRANRYEMFVWFDHCIHEGGTSNLFRSVSYLA
ncbi:hypothetical protein CAEBREN_11219 [Caenorhabditis brenneri]|uniref:Sdz-33 F-box domain-containing protein n=1 Tax=Caenorhabditis brenneri TaxID=135651 RepID=G0N0I8_CAEBE|nr:hypothetical protein CAEBREN_11219 [Caenorhabditis brenneri]